MNKAFSSRPFFVFSSLLFAFIFSLFVLLLPATAAAQSQSAERPVDWNIESSSFETFLSEGRAVYYGAPGNPAVFTYDTIRIEGDPINITMENNEITLLTTTGTPAVMRHTDDEGRGYKASANSIHYDHAAGQVTMQGDARIDGPDGINFDGCFFEYDIDANSVLVRACSPDERVNMGVDQEADE